MGALMVGALIAEARVAATTLAAIRPIMIRLAVAPQMGTGAAQTFEMRVLPEISGCAFRSYSLCIADSFFIRPTDKKVDVRPSKAKLSPRNNCQETFEMEKVRRKCCGLLSIKATLDVQEFITFIISNFANLPAIHQENPARVQT
jgi:hypothetical protein